MEEGFLLRDAFNTKNVTALSNNIKKVYPSFKQKEFAQSIIKKLSSLNFGPRSHLIVKQLYTFLPKDFPQAAQILIDSLMPEIVDGVEGLTEWDRFIVWPETEFIAAYGLDDYDISMTALYEMTKRFSSEGAIRPFIQKYPKKTLKLLEKWTKDPNCHVRRLVSEGTRPRLPLCGRLPQFQKDPRPVIQLLEKLKDDPSLYVRRSVANNLNDIAKDNPDIVVRTLTQWKKINNKETQWLITHAARTLLKQGNKQALALLGYTINPKLTITAFEILTPTFKIGESLRFSLAIQSTAKQQQRLMIDYAIHYTKANNKLKDKVFKLAKKTIKPNESFTLKKKHSFKQMTTRKHYPGKHSLEIIINGDSLEIKHFVVKK